MPSMNPTTSPMTIKDGKENEVSTTTIEQSRAQEFNGAFNEDDYVDVPPDGGYGWLCCACVTAMNFATWGVNCSYGIFLSFYLKNDVFPKATPTDYALIGGLIVFLTLILIPYSAVLLIKFGYRVTASIGIIIQLAGYIGASFSTTIGQLYVTQGILIGISYGFIFGANSIVLPSWFLKKRALANGISHFGNGLGGVVFTLAINKLIIETGDQKWALRVLAIVSFVICTVAMLLVKIRIPQNSSFKEPNNNTTMKIFRNIFDYKVWKSFPLQLATIWTSIGTTGYVICLYSLSNYTLSMGFSQHQAMVVTVVLNASQAVGRPMIGVLSEKCGRVNFTTFATFFTCIIVFVFWINLKSYGALIIFTILLGFFVGISSVNVVPLVVDVVGLNSFASGLGWANSFAAIMSLISEVIALNLRDYSLVDRNPYFHCQIFVGAMYFVAFLVLIPYREWRIKRMINQLKNSKNLTESEREQFDNLFKNNTIKGYLQRAFYRVKI
ncbi:unnamed protein product [Wickerhamomyces anomalus]